MPKKVDPQKRTDDIASAVFTIITTEGFPAVTFARISQQTGLAIGSIRHFFPTRQLLVESALDRLITTISTRIRAHYQSAVEKEDTPSRNDLAIRILQELLPFDTLRHQEAILWLQVLNEATHTTTYHPFAVKMSHGMRQLIAHMLERVLLYTPSAAKREANYLGALIDGITLAMITPSPTLTAQTARGLLADYITALQNKR